MEKELSFRERYPDANSAFHNWLIPHWEKYEIDILKLLPSSNDSILKIIGTKVSLKQAHDLQDQLIHDLSNLANIHYLGEGEGYKESLEAEEAEIQSLLDYALSSESADWSTTSWVEFIGNSKEN